MKKTLTSLVLITGILLPSFFTNNNVSATMTNTNTNPDISITSDKKYATAMYTANDIYLLPEQIWRREGEYAGYLTKTYIEKRRDGIWYGTYTGYLLKGPHESMEEPEKEY